MSSMRRAFVQSLAATCAVALPFLVFSSPAAASGHRTDQVLRCSVKDVSGYYKFSRQKPMLTSADQPIELRIKADEYQAKYSGSGVSRAIPVVFTEETISMSVNQGALIEKVSINGKTMAFEIVSSSPRHRLVKVGQCARLSV